MAFNIVLDACAVLASLTFEPGGDKVDNIITNHDGRIYVHTINVFEIAYNLMRKGFTRENAWELAIPERVITIDDTGPCPIAYRASDLKTKYRHLSLGDCFALALAESLNAEFITSDGGFRDCDTTAAITFFR